MIDKELGEIFFVHSNRAKYINIKILADGLRVTLPVNSTKNDALKFINSIRPKIIKKQLSIKQRNEKNVVTLNKNTVFSTLTFQIAIKEEKRENIYFELRNDWLNIFVPENFNFQQPVMQKHLWNGIFYFLRQEAKHFLPKRTQKLAEQHNFKYKQVKIQSSKTRWGSCSNHLNINLSFYLMLLPLHLVDYVILHELCHTVEMNHGTNFYQILERVTNGDSDKLKNELKKYSSMKFPINIE